jgi:hypothetical protein
MFFDFVEIGTSDFNTLIERADDATIGLAIDPIQRYLDRLPSPRNCIKLAAAISDRDGETVAHYVSPENIAAHGLPDWLRGCNAIGAPHPTVSAVLAQHGLDPQQVVIAQPIPCLRLVTVLAELGASGMYLLKTDTEGHDTVILNDFFDHADRAMWPHQLLFETNLLSDQGAVHTLIARLITAGYDIVHSRTGGGDTDTFLRLNLDRLQGKSGFTAQIDGYHFEHYPAGYDPAHPPHDNSPEAAAAYCAERGASGVSRRGGRFEVRSGAFLVKAQEAGIASWAYL